MDVNYLWLFLLGSIGGYLGKLLRIPGGVLLGAIVFTAVGNNLYFQYGDFPGWLTLILQVMAGALIGQEITVEMLARIKKVIFPVLITSTLMVVSGLSVTYLMNLLFGWNLVDAWLSSSPARMQDMILIADSLETNSLRVVFAHLFRTIAVLLITPIILFYFRTIAVLLITPIISFY